MYLDFEIVSIDEVAEQDLSYNEFDIDNDIDNDIDETALQDLESTLAVAEIFEELFGYQL